MSKVAERRCKVCTVGVVDPDGYGLDGRPQYRCARCGSTHTFGHAGHEWDTRPRREVRPDCACATCTAARLGAYGR